MRRWYNGCVAPVVNETRTIDRSNLQFLASVIADLYTLDQKQLIFSPGILVAMRLLLPVLNVRRLLLTDQEYYQPSHFPAVEVKRARLEDLHLTTKSWRPDALLLSLVSWKGERLPVNELIARIRSNAGAPLVFIDTSHAGAAGYPSLDEIDADVFFGDICKWLLRPNQLLNLSFLAARSEVASKVAAAFKGLYLAFPVPDDLHAARWVDPEVVRNAVEQLEGRPLNRAHFVSQHTENLRLAVRVAQALQIPFDPGAANATALLWTDDERAAQELPAELLEQCLLWHVPGRGCRIACRARAPYDDSTALGPAVLNTGKWRSAR